MHMLVSKTSYLYIHFLLFPSPLHFHPFSLAALCLAGCHLDIFQASSLLSSIVRPDYNTMVALILIVVIRQGKEENLKYVRPVCVCVCVCLCVFGGFEGLATRGHSLDV